MRGKHRRVAEINVVPYIDVMLVLLVIFMVTAPMLLQGVDVQLPQASAEPIQVADERDFLVVSVTQQEDYFLEVGGASPQPVALDALTDTLMQLIQNRPDMTVLVRGDREVTYGKVVELMSKIQQSGIHRVGLVTEPL
jgi:biopolymer transport protein TolR